MLYADGECDCELSREFNYSAILTGKGLSLKLKSKMYISCVRNCLIYGSETWSIRWSIKKVRQR